MQSLTLLAICLSFFTTQAAFSMSYVCKNGKLERHIDVVVSDPAKKVPCEVKYTKEGETEGKILWNAQADETFCDAKPKEFSEKQTAMGFPCEEVAAAAEAKPETKKE